ncbi:hypothetical protein PCL_09515 [Purpureocillium lilacinum]|uniref:Uncharacterized protein n=1 Tax=Purpureocillium lilacinum TaxID=33203 RepID=A0A2U3DQS6_PURLI|nr:hypothetical protein PCL_09515 [Purpureocillium lilacinum]
MAPMTIHLLRRTFDPGVPSNQFRDQWKSPTDVFSVLLILGGDVVGRALAQLAGSRVTPVAFSFGWVSYAVAAVVSAVGENKLMPMPDCACKVINGRTGYVRDNSSWVIGRIMRDFDKWMDNGKPNGIIRQQLRSMVDRRWHQNRHNANAEHLGSGTTVPRPSIAGLCVSIYAPENATPGFPGSDISYLIGFATTMVQLGVAAIPCGLYGDWGILLVTASGILLSYATGALPQWETEKWACRRHTTKTVILTRGNGSQHAIVIVGNKKGLDLEDLAAGQTNVDVSALSTTRVAVTVLAVLWILLLITAAGVKKNTWFLLAVGGIGILQNIYVAGRRRSPKDFGIPLIFQEVLGEPKVMDTLIAVEEKYTGVGRAMLDTFFPGELYEHDKKKWHELAKRWDRARR